MLTLSSRVIHLCPVLPPYQLNQEMLAQPPPAAECGLLPVCLQVSVQARLVHSLMDLNLSPTGTLMASTR